jgi:hypothetical protein
MAEEQIKIRIQADAADFKIIMDAVNAKLAEFGKTATIVAGNVKIVQKDIDNTADSIKKLGDAVSSSSEKMKSSNQQYTHLALILQDLPYGFRGIQNNLPALIGDFAGLAGPIYLAGSAIIAFFTAWDMGLFKVKNATSILDDAKKSYEETLKKSIGSAEEEIVKIQSLIKISSDHEISMSKRLKAVKELQDQYPSYFANLTKEEILNGNVTSAVDKVKDAIIARAEATAVAGKINELASQKFVLNEQLFQLALQKTKKLQEADAYVKQMSAAGFTETAKHQKGLIDAQIGGIRDQENVLHLSVGAIDRELTRLSDIYKTKKVDSLELDKAGPKVQVGDADKKKIELLKAKQEAFKQDILLFKDYEDQIINLEEKQAIKYKKAEESEQDIRDIYVFKRLKNRQDLSAKIQKLIEDDVKADAKAEKDKERISKDYIDSFNSDLKKEASNLNEFYRDKFNLATGDLATQKEILLNQRADLEIALALNLISWEGYSKAVGENVKAVTNVTAKMTKESLDSLMKIGNGIMSALGPSLDMLLEKGASIGEVLTNAFHSLINQLAKVAIAAAIAVALISILFPGTLAKAGGALKLFSGLIGQGMGIGGLIGGGASAGSAAISAGAGTNAIESVQSGITTGTELTARVSGNDLLFLMNKAQRNNNVSF